MAEEKVTFPMVGKVIEVHVAAGDAVEEDQPLATFESMKIEMPLAAPCGGTVRSTFEENRTSCAGRRRGSGYMVRSLTVRSSRRH